MRQSRSPGGKAGALHRCARNWAPLFAEFAGWEVARIDRLGPELGRVVFPERADVGVGPEHGVPEFILFVTEHLLLLDLLDVDVLDRAFGGEVEPHGTARR